MRYVNGILGYILLILGFLGGTTPDASSSGMGAACVAGAILIAIERYNDMRQEKQKAAED